MFIELKVEAGRIEFVNVNLILKYYAVEEGHSKIIFADNETILALHTVEQIQEKVIYATRTRPPYIIPAIPNFTDSSANRGGVK
jgi:hypothetical protein